MASDVLRNSILVFVSLVSKTSVASADDRVFEARDAAGHSYAVKLHATANVSSTLLQQLQQGFRIVAVPGESAEERHFWADATSNVIADRAEVQITVKESPGAPSNIAYTWPDSFQISRPGVLEVRPESLNLRVQVDDIDVSRQALGAATSARGHLVCRGANVQQVAVVAAGRRGTTDDKGVFAVSGPFSASPSRVYVAYKSTLGAPVIPRSTPWLEIVDDAMSTRNEGIDKMPSISGGVADFGDVQLQGNDCTLWALGINALHAYDQVEHKPPPVGGLRVKRWSAVSLSVGSPHTFYNYIVAPTDWTSHPANINWSFFHEFGHSLRFVADGDETHWHWDDFRFNYGHPHGGDLFNKGFSFSEGWGSYWAYVVTGDAPSISHKSYASNADADVDWDEDRVADRLMELNREINPTDRFQGAKLIMDIQLAHPHGFHTMYELEELYCKALPGGTNKFCSGGKPVRPHPGACPRDYVNDGATCRYQTLISKPSQPRGAGTTPNVCPSGQELDAGLCYTACPSGFHGVGPVCWGSCPPGYNDTGGTCLRNARIVGANNNACPWYDRCGLVSARGCSVCPAGFHNDGCTCRIDPDSKIKSSQPRGAGTVPSSCGPGRDLDAGLCYSQCPGGMHGVGSVCWGSCPAGFSDQPATCTRSGAHIFSNDPDN